MVLPTNNVKAVGSKKKAECGLLDSKYPDQIEDKEAAVNHQVSRYLSVPHQAVSRARSGTEDGDGDAADRRNLKYLTFDMSLTLIRLLSPI